MANTPLTDFNDLVEMMLEDMEETFPDHKQLTKYKISVGMARKANPRLILNGFYMYMNPFRDRILKCDEDFFLNTTTREYIEKQHYKDINGSELSQQKIDEAMNLKKIWMDPKTTTRDKACIWAYFHQLIHLADLAIRPEDKK